MANFKTLLFLLASTALCLGQVFPKSEDVYRIVDNFFQGVRNNFPVDPEAQAEPGDPRVTIKIKNGTLQGVFGKLFADDSKTLYSYRHIPFAAPPINELRFAPPQPFLKGFGNAVYDASRYSPACAQYLTHVQPASEDCLYLNVYSNRPANSTDTKLRPVMVFLHGGAFILGETSVYTGGRLLVEDIILVVPAYRLSVFGFFSTGDLVVPGNNALKDVVQALRWIKENIQAFGGDPDQVTLSGESAGAALASYVHISPLAKGLFHKVFLMSGTANSEWSIDRDPRLSANILAKSVDCPSTSTAEMVKCLREVPMKTLAKVGVENLVDRLYDSFRVELPGIVPVIEPVHDGAFLTEDPIKILQESDDLSEAPVMLGSVQHEGVLVMAIAVYLAIQPWGLLEDKHWLHHDMISQLMSVYGVDDSANGGTLSRTVALSFFDNNPRNNFTQMTDGMIDMLSVAFMKAPILRKAEILRERGRQVHIYSFEHYGRAGLWDVVFPLIQLVFLGKAVKFETGVMHGDDIPYLFATPILFLPDDRKISDIYVKLAGNFVIHGHPSPEDTPLIPKWPEFTFEDRHYLKINGTPTVSVDYATSWRQGVPVKKRSPATPGYL